jgi:hypothetical protein
MILVIMTFILSVAVCACLVWRAGRRVAHHLRGNPEAVNAVTEHVLLPMLGRQDEQKPTA